MDLNVNKDPSVTLFTANGGNVNVLGTARVRISNKLHSTVSTGIIADGMSHPALISWNDLINLKMISSSFCSANFNLS